MRGHPEASMARRLVGAMVCALVVAGVVQGEEPASAPAPAPAPSPPIARVLGKPITRADLSERARASGVEVVTDADLGSAVRDIILEALVAKYLDENGLRASDAEIDAFVKKLLSVRDGVRENNAIKAEETRARLADPAIPQEEREGLANMLRYYERSAKGEMWPDATERKQMADSLPGMREALSSGSLTDEQRVKIENDIANAERFATLTDEQSKAEWEKMEAEMNRAIAAPMIEWWKFNRSVFMKYGGRLLPQPGELEALDATKTWLEEREKAGDFEILDTTLLPGFWAYYTQDQTAFLIEDPEGTEFDEPWWVKAGD